jgi:hypothetical protein
MPGHVTDPGTSSPVFANRSELRPLRADQVTAAIRVGCVWREGQMPEVAPDRRVQGGGSVRLAGHADHGDV